MAYKRAKEALENQVRTPHKHRGSILKTAKVLKSSVESFEKKFIPKEVDERKK